LGACSFPRSLTLALAAPGPGPLPFRRSLAVGGSFACPLARARLCRASAGAFKHNRSFAPLGSLTLGALAVRRRFFPDLGFSGGDQIILKGLACG